MAAPTCNICGDTPATYLLNNLDTGDSSAFCVADFPAFILATAQALIPVPEEAVTPADAPPDDDAGYSHSDPPEVTESVPDAQPEEVEVPGAVSAPDATGDAPGTPTTASKAAGRSRRTSPEVPTDTVAQTGGEAADQSSTLASQ